MSGELTPEFILMRRHTASTFFVAGMTKVSYMQIGGSFPLNSSMEAHFHSTRFNLVSIHTSDE